MTREELTKSIGVIYSTLKSLQAEGIADIGATKRSAAPDKEPAVAIETSVYPDYLVPRVLDFAVNL
jgi:predicted transcriptional regulator